MARSHVSSSTTYAAASALTLGRDLAPLFKGKGKKHAGKTYFGKTETAQPRPKKTKIVLPKEQTVLPEPKPSQAILELAAEAEVNPNSPFFTSVRDRLFFATPSRDQIAQARLQATKWVREHGLKLTATSAAAMVVGSRTPELVALFNLNALTMTVPAFAPSIASLAPAVVGGISVGLTATTIELLDMALRKSRRKDLSIKAVKNKMAQTSSRGIFSRALGFLFGPALAPLATFLTMEIVGPSKRFLSRALGLKKKEEPQAVPFSKKGFFIRLGVTLAISAASALAGRHLRLLSDEALAAAAPSPEPQNPHAPLPASTAHSALNLAPAPMDKSALLIGEVKAPLARAAESFVHDAFTGKLDLPEAHQVQTAVADVAAQTVKPATEQDGKTAPDAQSAATAEAQAEPAAESEPAPELPPIAMPKMMGAYMSAEHFAALPRDVQEMALSAARTHNPNTFMRMAKEASFALLQNGDLGGADKAAGKLIREALNVGYQNGLLDTAAGKQLNADMAYLLATGKAGVQRDFTKAAYHMLLSDSKSGTTRSVTRILESRAPEALAAARADIERFRTQDLGLSPSRPAVALAPRAPVGRVITP